MAHEILERNHGIDGLVLIGVQKGGVWLARNLGSEIGRIDHAVPVGTITRRSTATTSGSAPSCPRSAATSR